MKPRSQPPPAARPLATAVVFHHDPPTLLSIKQAVEEVGGAIIGAHSAEAAVERLRGQDFDAVVVAWDLPDNAALEFLWHLDQAELEGSPFIVAFAGEWGEDDLRRAMQLGVDAFFGVPIDAAQLMSELGSLKSTGRAASRISLVERGGYDLIRPDPSLWTTTEDPEWRARMGSLAAAAATRMRRNRAVRLLEALDVGAGYPIDPVTAMALARVQMGEGVKEVAEAAGLGPTRLARLHRVALRKLRLADGRLPDDVARLYERVIAMVRKRHSGDQHSAGFKVVRRLAAQVVGHEPGTEAPPQAELFVDALAPLLGLQREQLELGIERLVEIASWILAERHEQRALDTIRLALLNQAFKRLRGGYDEAGAQMVSELLGCAEEPPDPELPERLMLAASRLSEEASIDGLSVASAAEVGVMLESMAEGEEVSRRLQDLANECEARGRAGRQRLAQIIDAIERGSTVRLPEAALATLSASLDHIAEVPEAMALWSGLRVSKPEQIAALKALFAEAPDICALDLPALAKAAGDPATFAQVRERLKARQPLSGQADARRVAQARALLLDVAQALDLNERLAEQVELGDLDDGADLEFEAILRLVPKLDTARRGRCVEMCLERWKGRPSRLVKLSQRLADIDAPLAAKLREELGLPPGPVTAKVVMELLKAVNLDGAAFASHDLSDEDPRNVLALGKVAEALQANLRFSEAHDLFERALRMQPKRLNLQLGMARVKIQLGRKEEARPLLEAVRARAPGFGDSESLWARLA